MSTLWLDQDAGGWRHKIGNDLVFCGAAIEVKVAGEWIGGRYEAENLGFDPRDSTAPRPVALLYVRNDERPLRIEEFVEARFPARP